MLFYNWNKIFTIAEKKPTEIFRIFKMLTNKEIPENKFDPIFKYSLINFHGTSFLLHPDVLLYNSYKYRYHDIAVYLAFASLRPFAEYIVNKTITLGLGQCPVDPRDRLYNSELITVEDGVLHFLYEQTPELGKQH